jgi:glutamyl-tRNA reductase
MAGGAGGGERGALAGKRVLVIGTGKLGAAALKNLQSNGVAEVWLVNRTRETAEALAHAAGGAVLDWANLGSALEAADIVLSCVAAETPPVTEALLRAATAGRPAGAPLVILDLALPRSVAPVALPGLVRYDLDGLRARCAEAIDRRRAEAGAAEELVATGVDRYLAWLRAREAAPAIAALRRHAETIREQELAAALRRLGDLSERDRNVVAALATGLVNRLLHEPVTYLRENPDPAILDQVHGLFGLAPDLTSRPPSLGREGVPWAGSIAEPAVGNRPAGYEIDPEEGAPFLPREGGRGVRSTRAET